MFLNRQDTKTQSTLKAQKYFYKWLGALASWWFVFTFLMIWPIFNQALAEEPVTYAPEFCEFSITFPEDPYKTRKCDDEAAEKRCYQQISYTRVFDMASTVNVTAICNPVGEDIRKEYSGDVMKATLRAMTRDNVVEAFDLSFREEEGYKQAGLVGEGKMGQTPTLYIAQLWIGEKSAFSLEAELIGAENEVADGLFSEILKSVKYKKKEIKDKK